MQIQLKGATNNLTAINDILEGESLQYKKQVQTNLKKFGQDCARVCYTQKDFSELQFEPYNADFVKGLLDRGHHSVFEHINLTFNMKGIPKIVAMVFNNEKQYATSEKSARYTQMKNIEPNQKEKYDKWMEILIPEIDKIYPIMEEDEKRKEAIGKLAQENARYMTSVFTPTKMVHTVNLRQINFLMQSFNEFQNAKTNEACDKNMKQRLGKELIEVNNILSPLQIPGLENQTDRHMSLFSQREVEEHFGDTYSTSYEMSFAGLAQAHRHRTINYHISEGAELDAPLGFFTPKIIRDNIKLKSEWYKDANEISKYDFPQAQLLGVNERGTIEDFRSKAILRMCGHAQHEIMENTTETATDYKQYQEEYKKALEPKCIQGLKCAGSCIWTGKHALERMV